MIENSFMHTIKYTRLSDSGTKDDYGQPVQNETAFEKKCFFDFPKEGSKITIEDSEIKVEGVVFMSKDDHLDIQLDDSIQEILNASGEAITGKSLRVIEVRKANDLEGIHHLEVKLGKA